MSAGEFPRPTNMQYASDANLNARIALHSRFSTNKMSFPRWEFDFLPDDGPRRLLEVGCGNGFFWLSNKDRVRADWQLTLTDLSEGMISSAEAALADLGVPVEYRAADVCALPFEAGSFDTAMANHMLYHISDPSRGLAELARVLVPGGGLLVATNGNGHLGELERLVEACGGQNRRIASPGFSLESAPAMIGECFERVELHRFVDEIIVDEVEPVVSFVLSLWEQADFDVGKFRHEVAVIVEREGAMKIRKSLGALTAWRRG